MEFGTYFTNIDELVSRSKSEAVAETAQAEQDKKAAAVLINYNANCGVTTSLYDKPMSAELRSELESNGYTIKNWKRCAVPGDLSLIE